MKPSVGEWVVWRRPLTPTEIEFEKKDPKAYPPIPRLYPMLVMGSDRVMSGDKRTIRVTGYVVKPPSEPFHTALPSGFEIRVGPIPRADWIEKCEGPSTKPGCWNWVGEPR